ncbi:hypothetical protein JXA63_03595 [Candidatus Woesebacteria bacterium]|nr:hypothetical protein [Candidatus Woesebacteria bacterium]
MNSYEKSPPSIVDFTETKDNRQNTHFDKNPKHLCFDKIIHKDKIPKINTPNIKPTITYKKLGSMFIKTKPVPNSGEARNNNDFMG